jgi:hypothetical protein
VEVTAISDSSVTFERGLFDTVPAVHSSGATIFFWQHYDTSDDVQYADGETIGAKMLTVTGSGTLQLGEATADSVVMGSRAFRPYPPGKVKVNGEYYAESINGVDEMALTWAHRDRTQETGGTFTLFTDGDVGPEAGVTYTLRIYGEAGTLLRTETGITAGGYTYDSSDELDDAGLYYGGWEAYYQIVLNDGPTALWRLGEASGTTMNDAGGSGYHGTYYNSPTLGATGACPGDTAVQFDGSNDYAAVPHNAAFNASAEWSIECWLAWTSTAYGIVFGKFYNFAPYQGPTVFANYTASGATQVGRIMCRDKNTSGYAVQSAGIGMADGTFRHFVFQRRLVSTGPDVWHLEIYINGVLDNSAVLPALTPFSDTNPIYIMGRPSSVQVLGGTMDELAYYVGKSLTAAEVAHHYASQAGGETGYRMNGGLRFELESVRDGYTSPQHHNIAFLRRGYGFNYGKFYGGV